MAFRPISLSASHVDNTLVTPLSFTMLKTDVPHDWVVYESESTLQFCLIKSDPPTVTRSVSINADFTWYVHTHGRVVPRDNDIIKQLPEKVASISVLKDILSAIKAARTCPGNPEERFVLIWKGEVVQYLESMVKYLQLLIISKTLSVEVSHTPKLSGTLIVKCSAQLIPLTIDVALVVENTDHSYTSCAVASPRRLTELATTAILITDS